MSVGLRWKQLSCNMLVLKIFIIINHFQQNAIIYTFKVDLVLKANFSEIDHASDVIYKMNYCMLRKGAMVHC